MSTGALARELPSGLSWQVLHGTSAPACTLLRSPASKAACVYWRLRIVETFGSTVIVHDLCSSEDFEVETGGDAGEPTARLRINSEAACIDAVAVVHAPDSPAAQSIAETFGLSGSLCVEEVLIPHGARLEVSGVLVCADNTTPFRSANTQYPLAEVTVKVPALLRRAQLVPMALGTGAALLAVLSAAGALVHKLDVVPIGRALVHVFGPSEVKAPRPAIVRWP